MKKLKSIILFILFLIVLPLLGNITLLTNWPVLVLAFVVVLLLWSQPPMNFAEDDEAKNDKGTMKLITVVSSTGVLISLVDWAYFKNGIVAIDISSIAGVFLIIIGFSVRLKAIDTLDAFFSSEVKMLPNQTLITSGLYHWLRHPSYTGALMVFVGVAFIFHSLFGGLILGPVMLWAYSRRIAVEEDLLIRSFGKSYEEYRQITWRLFPGW